MNWLLPGNLVLDPVVPPGLVAVFGGLLAGFTFWQYRRVGQNLGRGRNRFLCALRLLGIVLLLLLFLQPSRQETLPPPARDKITLLGLDTSRSMKQPDEGGAARLDAARDLMREAGIADSRGLISDESLRLYAFNDDASPVVGSAMDLKPDGTSTRLHKSVSTMLNSLGSGEAARALILLTDGHDFELINPARTGQQARQRQTPIYAVAFGQQGKARDISARITSFQPYIYVKQKARITAALRVIGCEFEDLQVELYRHNTLMQTRRLNTGELQELLVEFEVTEDQVGQYEYEVRAVPLEGESDQGNNSAITYLNVIDEQIKVLLLEGAPYWDTTFLQRSLMRNDKFNVDSLVQYAERKVRPIRKRSDAIKTELKVPATAEEFAAYDVVILGRDVDKLLPVAARPLVTGFVQDRGGTVIFSRGRAFNSDLPGSELEPVLWGEGGSDRVRLQVGRDGQGSGAFRGIAPETGGIEGLPELLKSRPSSERKPLTATLATVEDPDGQPAPAIVHRRFGAGQVVSIGVEGLWRWGFHAQAEDANTSFDRFWDQMILWLLAGRDFTPAREFSFRTSSPNIQLGEKVYFRLMTRVPRPDLTRVPIVLYHKEAEIARLALTGNPVNHARLSAEFLPEKTGRYRAVATFPDGTTQESRFIVFTENLEETEVATDLVAVKRLCESSGGRVLKPDELGRFIRDLGEEQLELTTTTRLTTIWDRAWVFYLVGLLFGVEWHLRRRWGLS